MNKILLLFLFISCGILQSTISVAVEKKSLNVDINHKEVQGVINSISHKTPEMTQMAKEFIEGLLHKNEKGGEPVPPPFPRSYHSILTETNNTNGQVIYSGRFWYDWENRKQRLDIKEKIGEMWSTIWRYDLVSYLHYTSLLIHLL
jgi:hypothetical protein